MTTSTARDLGEFFREQMAHATAIKLGQGRESDMLNIKVQTHPNGISGDQIVDIAILIHLNLRIACAGGKCAHDHRSTTLLAAQKLCNRIDIFNREPNNCAARRHPA